MIAAHCDRVHIDVLTAVLPAVKWPVKRLFSSVLGYSIVMLEYCLVII